MKHAIQKSRKMRRAAVAGVAVAGAVTALITGSGPASAYLGSSTVTVTGDAYCPDLMLPQTVTFHLNDGQSPSANFNLSLLANLALADTYTVTVYNVPGPLVPGISGFATWTCSGLLGTASLIDRNINIERPVGPYDTVDLAPN